MPDIEPTDSERKLLDALARDEVADFTTGEPAMDDPRGAAEWGTERIFRAELLRLVCTGRWPGCTIGQHGLQIAGAEVRGPLDLSFIDDDISDRNGRVPDQRPARFAIFAHTRTQSK